MNQKDILAIVDHTLLLQTATWEEIKAICDDGMKYETASVCIPTCYVKQAKEYTGDKMAICTVIGFPNGNHTMETKVFETKDAIEKGALEVDMVLNIGRLKDRDEAYVTNEIKAIKETAAKILTESSSVGLTQAAKDNKYEAQDTAYSKKDTSMDKTLLEALNALKEGETSKLIETATAVYIAKIDEEVDKKATEENRESIIAERENTLYSEKVKEWQKDDGWKVNDSVIDKIEFHNILTQKDPSAKNTEKVDSTEGK